MNSQPLLIRALNNQSIERPPVWLMRQAGRYMSEYRKLKEKYDFLTLCRTPELAHEVTMQPIDAFDMDAAIVFSDILVPATALGFDVDFNPGPVVANRVESAEQIADLRVPSYEELEQQFGFITQVLGSLRSELEPKEKALIGFTGAPWTMACYLLKQEPWKSFAGSSIFLEKYPDAMASFLEKLSDLLADYACLQIASGAQAVQIFDTWAGNLGVDNFNKFSLPVLNKLVAKVKERHQVPVILYLGNSSHLNGCLNSLNFDCFSLDHRSNLTSIDESLETKKCLQGNLEASILFAGSEITCRSTRAMLGKWKRESGLVANLGHGVLQKTPRDSVRAFVEEVKQGW